VDTAELHNKLMAKSLPLMTAYKTDLRHDQRALYKNPGVPFVHATRKTGTHILPLISSAEYPKKYDTVPYLFGRAERVHILEGNIKVLEFLVGCTKVELFLYFDGKRLMEIGADKAIEIIKTYVQNIKREWRKE